METREFQGRGHNTSFSCLGFGPRFCGFRARPTVLSKRS